jgi:hypothetical protein
VFARGEVSYHRVIGAVLLYLNVGLIFTSLFCFVALIVPKAWSGIGRYRTILDSPDNTSANCFNLITIAENGRIAVKSVFHGAG